MRLEDLRPNSAVRGVHPDGLVTVVSVQWFGSAALELTYKTPSGTVANELLYRDAEDRLEIVAAGRPWSFDGDGALFRLVSEAQRIRLAHLFDPLLAVHTSVVDPLPHQITGVYEAMLPRQPLRFLLADDPGAGKTIMAGLLIKELIARGDLERCLIVCPGSLAEQWQDELYRRFQLPFEILTNDKLEAARTRNWFLETDLVIARLDKLSRDEDVQQKLQAPDAGWDLVVCDEAHKLSATFFGGEVKYTKRYRLGQLLSGLTRHFLLMTATPHNGSKEQDFQLFLALLDGDRFEGRFRDGVHKADVSDLMRRMVKERLLKFDGKPLFPERIAYTVPYRLSDEPAADETPAGATRPAKRFFSARCAARFAAGSDSSTSMYSDGSSTICEKITARAAASGRRAHHRCSVDGWPCRIDFSRDDAVLIASSGSATSISFFLMGRTFPGAARPSPTVRTHAHRCPGPCAADTRSGRGKRRWDGLA